MTTAARPYPDGARVQVFAPTSARPRQWDWRPATVVAADLIGVRHPGWVYQLRLEDGSTKHAPAGVVRDAE